LRRADGTLAAACLYGPGGGGNPHAPDEFYYVDHLVPVAQNIVSAMLAFYGLG
jgi:acetylornithine deacetylase/succinyl-diaminopimelate desuccinylase-like protein